MDWTCPCGRTWPETKSRCAACGERRQTATFAAAKVAAPPPPELVPAPAPEPEATSDTGEVALAVYPRPDLPPEAVSAFGEAFGLGVYDARRRLEVPFPQVAATGPNDVIEPLGRGLSRAGIWCGTVPTEELFQILVPRKLTRVESLSTSELKGWGPDGNGPAVPIVSWTIDLTKPRLVVVGSWTLRASVADRKLRFIQVWYAGEDRPFELVEKDMKQFDLGPRQKPSARANLEVVLEALGAPPAKTDSTLFTDSQRVGATAVLGGELAGAFGHANVSVADVISRLMRFGWEQAK